jgi:hypothetical protein
MVNKDVYGNYIKEKYLDGDDNGDVIIERNREMGTQSVYHNFSLPDSINGYQLINIFKKGKVEVEIFQRAGE